MCGYPAKAFDSGAPDLPNCWSAPNAASEAIDADHGAQVATGANIPTRDTHGQPRP